SNPPYTLKRERWVIHIASLPRPQAPPLPSGHFQQITFWFKWLGFYQERDFFSPGFTQYTRARKDKLEIIRRAYDRLACQVFGAYLPKPNDQMVLFFCEKQKRQEK
ncbi:hypothetical protein, partial [Jeotgalibaca porci]|uniref:hypothetical protein n=1 Tax=Jeotgalibaca porci TaxID=1868793 RepID=UPI0035A15C3A